MRFSLRCEGDGILRSFVTIVVDVANVMGSRPDGWWRDRAGAAVRLHAQIAQLAASGRAILPPPGGRAILPPPGDRRSGDACDPAEVTPGPAGDAPGPSGDHPGSPAEPAPAFVLVLEGAARAAVSRLPAASSGEADPARPGEVRVVEARGSGDDAIVAVVRELPGRRVVVTADRELRARCAAAGAEILGPGWLLGLL
jgi:8-oxo-dGTP diphosphatase